MSRAHISKSKRCFNVKSSTYYFHMKTKILADFQIYINVPLSKIKIYFFLVENYSEVTMLYIERALSRQIKIKNV